MIKSKGIITRFMTKSKGINQTKVTLVQILLYHIYILYSQYKRYMI